MNRRLARTLRPVPAVALWLALCGPALTPARGAGDPALDRALAFLRGQGANQQTGETALIALALLKADVPPGDPAVASCIARLRQRFSSGAYQPQRTGGLDIYEAAVVALALATLDPSASQGDLTAVAQFLTGRQNANGSWDYSNRTYGDTSISQHAVLGLWEIENAGVSVSPGVWDRAAQFFLSTQSPEGSWTYHRDERSSQGETVSMTAAGAGSLLICQRQLARHRRGGGGGAASPLLSALTVEGTGQGNYDVAVPASRVDAAVRRGIAWLAANFNPASATMGQSPYYGLYGIERLGALAGRENLGRANWFEEGRAFLAARQRSDGAWDSTHGAVPNTAWGVLFLSRSTKKSIQKIEIKRLGAGTLLGGRGIPKDVSTLTVAGGRVVSRPMSGAVEGMLAVLEDPRSANADSALAGLVERYRAEGPAVLRPRKDRFRKLLKDRDPDLRRVAAWALSRTGDLDVAPPLIESLNDPDEGVVQAVREGLQLLSRKIDGPGPPTPSTPAQRQEAARAWRAWYEAIKPLELDGQDAPADGSGAKAATPEGGPR